LPGTTGAGTNQPRQSSGPATSSAAFGVDQEDRTAKKSSFDLNEIILGVVALMRSQAEEQHVALDARLSQHLPAVLADRIQVQEVILNLVKNALESLIGCEGYREVSIGSRALQGSEVVVDVKDSGKGRR